jgi:hypothetical protein
MACAKNTRSAGAVPCGGERKPRMPSYIVAIYPIVAWLLELSGDIRLR